MPIPLSTKINKVPALIKGAYQKAKQAMAPKFTDHQKKWLNITIDHVSRKFQMEQKPDIKIVEHSWINMFKTPGMATFSIAAGFGLALGLTMEPLMIPITLLTANILKRSVFSALGSYCSGKGIHRIFYGRQKIFIKPNMPLDDLIFVTAHETTHHLRNIGIIKDDRIADSVGIMCANDYGRSPFTFYGSYSRDALSEIKEHGAEQFLTGVEKKGLFFSRTQIAERFGKSYEFGDDIGAVALYLNNRQGPDHAYAWNFLRLVGQGTHPIEAYREAQR